MKNLAEKFLTDSDKAAIQNAVKQAEKTTSGEIVPLVVSSSYNYPLSDFIGGFAFAIIIALSVVLIFNNENLWLFLAVFTAGFLIMREIIKYVLPLKRLFISEREIDEEVEEAVISAFYKNGLYKTRDETGVLIFISAFERKVLVIADRGINEKVKSGTWQEIVDMIIKGIKEKRQTEAIVNAVARVGEILHVNFPIKKDDTNELPDLIIKKKESRSHLKK